MFISADFFLAMFLVWHNRSSMARGDKFQTDPLPKISALNLLKKARAIIPLTVQGQRQGLRQPARRDSTIFIRDALNAGNTPPTRPMIKEKARPFQIIAKVRVKLKASSEADPTPLPPALRGLAEIIDK